jgi:hypothetical protein
VRDADIGKEPERQQSWGWQDSQVCLDTAHHVEVHCQLDGNRVWREYEIGMYLRANKWSLSDAAV